VTENNLNEGATMFFA